jgi:hypothetical protein
VSENELLRREFGIRSENVTEDYRELHSVTLHDTYHSPIKDNEMGSACSTEDENETFI